MAKKNISEFILKHKKVKTFFINNHKQIEIILLVLPIYHF